MQHHLKLWWSNFSSVKKKSADSLYFIKPCRLAAAAAAAAKLLQSCPTVWSHRWQPSRLLRSWDSPGKNTGVGCHFLLQCMKVKSESEVAQSCLTLRDPMDCSLPGSSIHGIFQARVLEWGAIALSGVDLHHKFNTTGCLFTIKPGYLQGQHTFLSWDGYSPNSDSKNISWMVTLSNYTFTFLW